MDEQERQQLEVAAYAPNVVAGDGFNSDATLPFGCATAHIGQAMATCIEFLRVVNAELHAMGMVRLESLLMPANFSSVVSEFMNTRIREYENTSLPRYCPTRARNTYHNGQPDLVPVGEYPGDAAQYAMEGVEVKASRSLSG
jgi:hypothetical protein